MISRVLFFLILLANCANARADIQFRWIDERGAPIEGDVDLESFGGEVRSLLPARIREVLSGEIRVAFDLGERASLDVPACGGRISRNDVYGESFASRRRISLHRGFRRELAREDSVRRGSLRRYECKHQDVYRLALATLVHELGHLYDHAAWRSPEEQESIRRCMKVQRRQREFRSRCISHEKSVSDIPQFLNLIAWSEGLFGWAAKNENRLRSPDPYEFASPAEAFAVNLEYYLLDPQYSCRRPALAKYLDRHLGRVPPPAPCELNTHVVLNAERTEAQQMPSANLDPRRVYQVHYLLAGKGDSISSRWGHAMFRLVICAPGREPGPDCLNDWTHHVVVSYRANVADMILDYWKGLNGGYPSQMYLIPFPQIITEYTQGETRDLFSLPLRLSEEEKEVFVLRVLEQHWEYAGRYYFLSNNCATESIEFLKGVMPDRALQRDWVISPLGMYEDLVGLGVVDETVLIDRESAIEAGYIFESRFGQYERAWRRVRLLDPSWEGWDLEDFLSDSVCEARRRAVRRFLGFQSNDQWEAALKPGEHHDQWVERINWGLREQLLVPHLELSDLATLESAISVKLDQKIREGIVRLLDDPLGTDLRENLSTLSSVEDALQTWKLPGPVGYGVSLNSEYTPGVTPLTEQQALEVGRYLNTVKSLRGEILRSMQRDTGELECSQKTLGLLQSSIALTLKRYVRESR